MRRVGVVFPPKEVERPEAEQALTMQGASSEASPAPKKAEKKTSAKKTKKQE